jgi:t-SNARE complex subunit (syntaxin)
LLTTPFRKALKRVESYLRSARELDLNLAATRAASQLVSDPVKGQAKTSRPALIDIIKLARDSRARRRHEVREASPARLPMAHPSISREEAASLLAGLQGNQPE